MTTELGWLAGFDSPLFAHYHHPADNYVRAGVLLCNSLGQEAPYGRLAFRALGRHLASLGFAVLQVDYAGTGDSWGQPGVGHWESSILAAGYYLRAAGAGELLAVGFRLGALLVTSAAGGLGLKGLVLWDPCLSGRSYLKEQVLLRAAYAEASLSPGPSPSQVEILGGSYDGHTVSELSQLKLERTGLDAQPAFLVASSGRSILKAAQRLAGPRVEVFAEDTNGQGVPAPPWGGQRLDEAPLGAIAQWLQLHAGRQKVALGKMPLETRAQEGSRGISEEVLRIGPRRLFAVLARPARPTPGPVVVALNAGFGDHLGPGGLWVDLSRQWAKAGVPVLRADLGGLGDSTPTAGNQEGAVLPTSWLKDVKDIVGAMSCEYPAGAILMGLCSGALHAALAAPVVGAKGAIIVNPSLPLNPLGKLTLKVARRLSQHAERLGSARLARWTSSWPWWFVRHLRLARRPLRSIERLNYQGASSLLVCGTNELEMLAHNEPKALRRLKAGRFCQVESAPEIDHSLFTQDGRHFVLPLLDNYVRSNCIARAEALEAQAPLCRATAPRHGALPTLVSKRPMSTLPLELTGSAGTKCTSSGHIR